MKSIFLSFLCLGLAGTALAKTNNFEGSCSITTFDAQQQTHELFRDQVGLPDGQETLVFAADGVKYVVTAALDSGVQGEIYLSLKQVRAVSGKTISESVSYPKHEAGFRLDNVRVDEGTDLETYFTCSLK